MVLTGEIVLNSLLAFLTSAKDDHTKESLIEIANSFHSHADIKEAKVDLTNLV